jgi:hypothetical protein
MVAAVAVIRMQGFRAAVRAASIGVLSQSLLVIAAPTLAADQIIAA